MLESLMSPQQIDIVKGQLDQVKGIMTANIESVLQRGDRIETLVGHLSIGG